MKRFDHMAEPPRAPIAATVLAGGFAGLFVVALSIASIGIASSLHLSALAEAMTGRPGLSTADALLIGVRAVAMIMVIGSVVALPLAFLLAVLMRVARRATPSLDRLSVWLFGSIVLSSPLALLLSRGGLDWTSVAVIGGAALVGGLVSWRVDRASRRR